MIIDMFVFMLLALRYKYVENTSGDSSEDVISNGKSKMATSDSGHSNAAYIE